MNVPMIARTAALGIVLINAVLNMMGSQPLAISEEMIFSAVSSVLLVATAIWTWWKNNSITAAAQTGDKVMCAIKNENVDPEIIVAVTEDLIEQEKMAKLALEEA